MKALITSSLRKIGTRLLLSIGGGLTLTHGQAACSLSSGVLPSSVAPLGTAATVVSPQVGNLLSNPGFEEAAAADWNETVSESVNPFDGRSAEEYVSGLQARGYWCNPGGPGVVRLEQSISNVTAGTYQARLQTRSFAYQGSFAYRQLNVLDGQDTLATVALPYGDQFQEVVLDGIIVPEGASVTFQIVCSLPQGNGYLSVDDAIFERVTPKPEEPRPFAQQSPTDQTANQSLTPVFSWAEAPDAVSYTLTVADNPAYTDPVVDTAQLTGTRYTPTTALASNTTYYWKVVATTSAGPQSATNAGSAFTTRAATPPSTYYYVAPTGQDAPAGGTQQDPYRTIAYAAQQVPADQNSTLYVTPGTYVETQAIVLPPGVNLEGAGRAEVTVTAAGPIPAPDVDVNSPQYYLWYDGSLIQLASPIYPAASPKYGTLAEMIAPQNGNQTVSGLTLDGNNARVKAGLWVENRHNVTIHDIDFQDFELHGAVASRGDMVWYEPLPEGKWMRNTTVYNCTFTNCAADNTGGTTSGVLGLGGLDGANIYNLTINEDEGYGIKFKHVGHLRNVKIHDCTITVPEEDPIWGEDIAIELWNFSYDNEIYNIECNTWLSLVNHPQLDKYYPTPERPSTVKIRNLRMIDQDGVSGKEAVEINNLSGVEVSDSYFQDKGFYLAIWGGTTNGGASDNYDIDIHHNVFANVNRTVSFGFGNSAGIFVPDRARDVRVYHNVFDNMGVALDLNGGSGFDIRNNVFQNSQGDEVKGGSALTFTHNLRYHTDPQRQAWVVSTAVDTTNRQGNPEFSTTGARWDTYYQATTPTSPLVDWGTTVGFPYAGSAPDIGRWEFAATAGLEDSTPPHADGSVMGESTKVYPNPASEELIVQGGQNYRAILHDLSGRPVMQRNHLQGKATLNIRHLRPGMYLLTTQDEDGHSMQQRLLIE